VSPPQEAKAIVGKTAKKKTGQRWNDYTYVITSDFLAEFLPKLKPEYHNFGKS
jgi:hypothetical protein